MDADLTGQVITGLCGVLVAAIGVWGAVRVERVKKVAERAAGAADTAVEQTKSTGNGHAGRVEQGLKTLIQRFDEADARLSRIEAEVGQVREHVTSHLQAHATADVTHRDRDIPRREVA